MSRAGKFDEILKKKSKYFLRNISEILGKIPGEILSENLQNFE